MLARKMKILPGQHILIMNPIDKYIEKLADLPEDVTLGFELKPKQNFVHLFAKDIATLESELLNIMPNLEENAKLWISFPKGISGFQTDLSRDNGWESLSKYELKWTSLISFDEDWSAVLYVYAKKISIKKTAITNEKCEWIDTENRIVHIPNDLQNCFIEHPNLGFYFNNLAFTHKKEYVFWLTSAKKADTREKRLVKMLQMLESKMKQFQ